MVLHIIQYLIKSIIIIFGIVIFFNLIELDIPESTRMVLGLIVTLFGVYRIIIYNMKRKKYYKEFDNEDDE